MSSGIISALTPEERRELARAATRIYTAQRYGATWHPDKARRREILQRWQDIADGFDPEPYGHEDRLAELRTRRAESDE